MDLYDEIALNLVRMNELLAQVDKFDASASHKELLKAVKLIERGIRNKDFNICEKGVEQLYEILEPVKMNFKLWREISTLIDLDRKLINTERKWQLKADQMIPMKDIVRFIRNYQHIIYMNIPDKDTRTAIFEEIKAYFKSE